MTTHNTHTPGPWVVTHQTSTDHAFDIVAPRNSGGITIATCGNSMDIGSVLAHNARLIAAAPEMLDALHFARRIMGSGDPITDEVLGQIDEIIVKAEGQP